MILITRVPCCFGLPCFSYRCVRCIFDDTGLQWPSCILCFFLSHIHLSCFRSTLYKVFLIHVSQTKINLPSQNLCSGTLSLPYTIIVALFHDTIHWNDPGTMKVIKSSAFWAKNVTKTHISNSRKSFFCAWKRGAHI